MGVERRLFFAVDVGDEARHALAAFLSDPGMPEIPGKRVPPPNWHITLRFLGRSTTLRQEKVLAALDERLSHDPFDLALAGFGAFPRPKRATVVWLAIERGHDGLDRLAQICEAAAVAAGYDPEERPFHPHLTLSRLRPHQDVTDLVEDFRRFPGRVRVDSVVLYETFMGSHGARYNELDRVPLR